MSQTQPVRPGSPEFYRAQAAQMLQKADQAASDESRAAFLNLAENWHRLAKQAEEPGW
jgi:hypothetical protein